MHVTVCVCTRDRGESITSTLRSLVASSYDDFDVVVVDQSAADDTAAAVRQVIAGDERFAFIRSHTHGSSRARNIALAHARGPLVAFTDDDCVAPPQWLPVLAQTFAAHPDAGQICGAVLPAPYDAREGFIPTYEVARFRRVTSPWRKWQAGGILANSAYRLDALRAVGPFDEVLGAGGPLYSCVDGDMTYRMLRAGYFVLMVPEAYVMHSGFRSWQEGQPFMRRVGIGIGATYAKHLRLGDVAVLPTLLYEWGKSISWKRLLLLRRYTGVARFITFAVGMRLSFHYRIDRRRRIYLPRVADVPPAPEHRAPASELDTAATGSRSGESW